ncbi:proteasome subunit beta [Parenemella sanctibonifatiensis]|uniref:Proteasome subunit beta n=1 Tax=Parenemella sanctibonifatiensis TaxID=2016505 RepID=A0A255ESH4_9ACTN|nr:proteasome subunit beta [Parenemella sanctibonifatiensis]OYN91073.1 proteasome subunit beta [Parenemella sanctibonifatiensis]
MNLPGLEAYLRADTASFTEFLTQLAPHQLPSSQGEHLAPHGTTVVAAIYEGGVLMAGDRRATMGHAIAYREVKKVHEADDQTVIGIAGTAGVAIELVKLYQVELEHYEKMEGTQLSFAGKGSRLSGMLRATMGRAMQGLAAIPLLAGWDGDRGAIFAFDIAGGRYPERHRAAIGSGAVHALGALRKLHDPAGSRDQAIRATLHALWDAADQDAGTGGIDLGRQIYPQLAIVEATGVRELSDAELQPMIEAVVADRQQHPDGPRADL